MVAAMSNYKGCVNCRHLSQGEIRSLCTRNPIPAYFPEGVSAAGYCCGEHKALPVLLVFNKIKPMDTAPKDGTKIRLYNGDLPVAMVEWGSFEDCWQDGIANRIHVYFDGWASL